MLRLIANVIYVLSILAVLIYATTGSGLFGRQAEAANYALSSKALSSFMNLGERYFQAHPLYQPAIPPPPQPPQTEPVDKR